MADTTSLAKTEMTVPGMPVGAGTEQSPKTNKLSIAQDDDDCNPLSKVKIYLAEKDKREAGFIPAKPCLSVTNLNDLYSYSFKGTPPIIENFLYPGVSDSRGCADGAMVLTKESRTDNNAELSIVGRDMSDQKLLLVRNTETLCWDMTEREVETFETRIDPELMKIVNLITDENSEWIGTPSDLIEESGAVIPVNMITKTLNVNSSELKNRFNINYISGRTSVSRWIRLYRDTPENDSNDSNDGLNSTPKQLSQPSQPS